MTGCFSREKRDESNSKSGANEEQTSQTDTNHTITTNVAVKNKKIPARFALTKKHLPPDATALTVTHAPSLFYRLVRLTVQ